MAKTAAKIIAWIIVILLLAGAGFCYYKYLWVFSDGTKTGELNSVTYTGYIWIFKFSVADKAVAEELQQLTGQRVTVHFKEYKGALPWRGYERAIVDIIENSEPIVPEPANRLPYDASAEQLFL